MTHITLKNTKTKDYAVAQSQLINLIAQLNKKTSAFLITELLTETEQVMFTKRFASLLMFEANYTPYRVSETLGLSTSTTRKLYTQYDEEKYSNLLSCMKKKETSTFLRVISDIIAAQVDMKARARLTNRNY